MERVETISLIWTDVGRPKKDHGSIERGVGSLSHPKPLTPQWPGLEKSTAEAPLIQFRADRAGYEIAYSSLQGSWSTDRLLGAVFENGESEGRASCISLSEQARFRSRAADRRTSVTWVGLTSAR